MIDAARAAAERDASGRATTLKRLRRTLHAIEGRDYFPPPEREEARGTVEALAQLLEVAP